MSVRLPEEKSPLLVALMEKRVKAETIDMDHFRIHGGMAVETDYIILVEPKGNTSLPMPDFESFTLSKTYSAFRTLAQQLKKAADTATGSSKQLPKSVQKLAQYCETVHQLVESQRTQYLGKVNYNYVKALAKKRIHIVNEILETTLSYFPDEIDSHKFHKEVALAIETFFLLDHCVEDIPSPESTGHRRARTLSGGGSRSFKLPKKEPIEKKQPRALSVHALGEPLVEPLVTVGHAVGTAVDTVGTFFKDRIGEIAAKATPSTAAAAAATTSKPTPIDTSLRSPVVPYTRKTRMSIVERDESERELIEIGEEANLLLDDERPPTELVPSYSHPLPTFGSPGSKLGDLLETNPIMFLGIFVVSCAFLKFVAQFSVTMDLDILLLLIWASFCIGLHTPRPMVGGIDKSTTPLAKLTTPVAARTMRKQDRHGRQLLRMSMASTPDAAAATAAKIAEDYTLNASSIHTLQEIREEEDDDSLMAAGQSPLPRFPVGAPLGSKNNCWSEPDYETFHVRGAKYLSDKQKEASGPFIFPIRAVDLFLTDNCPENAGSNSGILGGKLREKPTFIINFRLPWGIFLAYFEIPERFIPFVRAAHEEGFDKSSLPSLDSMSPSDRCVARFCQDPPSEKNKKLKIVPVVVEGPWVVKSVVGGKPAIIGNKLPVNYHYSPATDKKALYLEADLDIVASSAARGILSVTRTYTQVLTIDLGFVVQGNTADELPEQMLVGARLHGIDPITAPPYPLSGDMLMQTMPDGDDSLSD